jgi:hypothetical protein
MTSTEATTGSLTRRHAMRMAGFAALAGGAGLAVSPALAQTQREDTGLAGVWRTRSESVSPGANRLELHQVFVFIPGGIFLIIDSPVERTANLSDIPTAVEYVGPYAGQWLQEASGTIHATAIQLNYDGLATHWSEERVNYTLTLDESAGSIRGEWDWRETARDGSLILAAGGTIEGFRISLGRQ